ncbi:MAG: hypothetical protein FJZ11_00355 [Candidatus Omnitrophica bacterium]|nr:hypothetical protein [Candidatus Omnitrophota bacterium]
MKPALLSAKTTKVAGICDKIILFSIYAVVFFLPISKGIIETFSSIAIVFFIIKKLIEKKDIAGNLNINLAVMAYTIICFISIFISSNPAISFRSFWGKIMQDVAFFFVVVGTLNTERRLKNTAYILFASSLLIGIDGIYQHFTLKEFIRHRRAAFPDRISSAFITPNDFACYLVTVIPFTLSLFFVKFRFKIFRLFIAALFILLLSCLILTVSRGAWIAFIVLALFMSVWLIPLRLLLLLLVPAIIGSLTFFPSIVKERLSNFFIFLDNSGIDRKIIWEAAWKMFMSRPWLGLGLGTFMFNFDKFVIKNYPYGPSYAHNCYLQMGSEIGIIGLVSFLSILGLFFYRGIKKLNHGQKTFFWYVLMGSLAAILGYSVHMGVDTFLYSVDLGLLFWLILGMGVAAGENVICAPKSN